MAKNKLRKKDITLDDLAAMVQRGFSEQAGEIKGVKSELAGLKSEFADFRAEFELFARKTDRAIFNLQSEMSTVSERLNNIEKILVPLMHLADALKLNSRDHESRISRLERKMGV